MKKKLYTFSGNFIDIVLFMITLVIGAWLQCEMRIDSVIMVWIILFAIAFVLHSIATKIRDKIAKSVELQNVEDKTEIKD